ncbi:RecB-like exonuclease/helicase [Microbacterium phage Araxxi]|uniref:RecB-like exonuclease/helicase n=1 Tax=Microbacterium phage Araxxi TaxID=2590948 RepID=A0A516KT44_9CAUD|nr:exonuclease [Microbacterium phage Araxxi]QDP44830.1 RecB-like exonuclease/helicase [Microbacterium phage Araxxi]
MQCPGSANLELAIPGYVEPKRDEMAGAKGVGTRLHDSFRQLAHWDTVDLSTLVTVMYHYRQLGWRKRRSLMEDITDSETWLWIRQYVQTDDMTISKILSWMEELDKDERLPPQMLIYVQQTIEELETLLLDTRADFYQIIEERSIECTWLKSSPLTTPDLVIAANKRLVIVDYKTGKIPVSPVANDQLMFYAVSALYQYVIPQDRNPDLVIDMMIWQPGHFESWTTDLATLEAWKAEALAADLRVINKDLTLRPGSSCTFCPANPHSRGDKAPPYCPAQMSLLYPNNTDEEAVLDL